jgi:hypothetical protein
MRFDGPMTLLLAEFARRRPAFRSSLIDQAEDAAKALRSIFHPKQRAFYTSPARFRATRKTRRAGATSGGAREFIARAITHAGWRGVYVTTTKIEARARAWENDTRSGFLDILRQHGTHVDHPSIEVVLIGGVRAEIYDGSMEIVFDNGSKIELFGADSEKDLRKQRGLAKHVYWIDEAQDFTWLQTFIDKVALASLGDYNGECWVTGTPGQECTGLFYDITKEPGEDGEPTEGWDVHTFAQVDNPFFGHVVKLEEDKYTVEDNDGAREGLFSTIDVAEEYATKVRWDRATRPARDRGLKTDDPDFIREFLGKWVREDMRFVYPIHGIPKWELHAALKPRLKKNPFKGTHERFEHHPDWCDFEQAIRDLPKMPKYNKRRQWMFAIGVDFGYNPDPFAIVVWAFAVDTTHVYEVFSWKCIKVHTDDQGAYLKLVWDALPNVVSFVGDPAGKIDDFEMWRGRLGLPIDEANKKGKETLEAFLADDVRLGRIHPREDSPLHEEMKYLSYLPTKPGKPRAVNKHRRIMKGKEYIVPGDHCCDAARYSYVDLTHFLSKTPPTDPKPGSPAHLEKQAEKIEQKIEKEDARAERLMRGDEEEIEYGNYGYE